MISVKTWSRLSVLRMVAGILMTLSLGLLISSVVLRFIPAGEGGRERLVGTIILTLSFQGAALVWVHFFLKGEGIGWIEGFGLGHAPMRAIAWGIGAGGIALPVVLGWNQMMVQFLVAQGIKPEVQPAVQRLQEGVGRGEQAYLAVVALVLAPVVEEILFRGILYPTLKQAGYPGLAMWGTSLAFGAIHFNLVGFLPLTVFALILVWVYEQTDNLLAPIVIHGLFNTVNFLVIVWQEPITRYLEQRT